MAPRWSALRSAHMQRRGAAIVALMLCSVGTAHANAEPEPASERSAAARRGAAITAPRLGQRPVVDVPSASASELGLSAQADGSFHYVDPGRRFSARIHADGAVSFGDRWKRPDRPGARRPKPERGRCCGAPAEGVLSAINVLGGAPVSGPTEWVFRARGHDPVAAAKADMLARSREFRARLAVAWHRDVLRVRLRELPRELEKLWADPQHSAHERRAWIFRRWDECDEALVVPVSVPVDSGALGRARTEAAMRARRAIERFVRLHLPADSADAFTAEELEQWNATRTSREPFAPYEPEEPSS